MLALTLAQAGSTLQQVDNDTWTSSLVNGVVLLGIVLIVFGQLLCLFRLLKGPHLADRVIAVDTMGILLIGLVVLVSIRYTTLWFLDAVLVLSLLAFAGTVAMAQYIARPHLKKARQQAAQNTPEKPADQAGHASGEGT